MRTSAQGMLGKNRMAKAGFDEPFDRFGVVSFHDDAGRNADFFEKAVDDQSDVAAFGIKEKGNIRELGSTKRADVTTPDFVGRGANDEKLFIEKRDELELGFRDGKRNESQIETAVEQTGDHFFGDADGDANFRVGKAFAKLAQGRAELIDESGNAGGEMKR